MISTDFSKNLNEYARENNYSAAEISRIFGITYSNVKAYLKGGKELSLNDAARILTVPENPISIYDLVNFCGIDNLDLKKTPLLTRTDNVYLKDRQTNIHNDEGSFSFLCSNRKAIEFFDECGRTFFKPDEYVDIKAVLSIYFNIYDVYQYDPNTNILSLFPDEVMAPFMRTLMNIRGLKNEDIIEIPQRSSKAQHIRRDHPISLFAEAYIYEEYFRTGGFYLFTEILNTVYKNRKGTEEYIIPTTNRS